MNNDGKSGIRSGAGFADHLRALGRLLFGSPCGLPRDRDTFIKEALIVFLFSSPDAPPLNRKDFIKAALVVFFVRGPISGLLLWLCDRATSCEPELPTLVLFMLPAALVFCCPYFFVMYRRLVFLACPRPRLVTWAAVIFLLLSPFALIVLFGDLQSLFIILHECETITSLDLLSTALCIIAYLPLFIPDRRPNRNSTLTPS